jgi:hypothetical protein
VESTILAPAAALVLWSLIVLLWTAFTRFQAFAKQGIDIKSVQPGGRGANLEGVLPDNVMWKSHNYTHLMEQPTLFYAVVAVLAITGAGYGTNTFLAWAYVGLRIVHSVWQATVNRVSVRFALFILSTICLFGLTINALRATL